MGKRIKKICLMIGSFFLAILHIYNKGKKTGEQSERLKHSNEVIKAYEDKDKNLAVKRQTDNDIDNLSHDDVIEQLRKRTK